MAGNVHWYRWFGCRKLITDTCNHSYCSADRLFAGKIYTGPSKDLQDRYDALRKENGNLKQELNNLKNKTEKAHGRKPEAGGRGGGGVKRGAERGARGGRGGGRGRGAADGAVDTRPGLGWSRDDKIAYTCVAFNKGKAGRTDIRRVQVCELAGDACDGSCNLAHRCSKEETHGRFCWKDHSRCYVLIVVIYFTN